MLKKFPSGLRSSLQPPTRVILGGQNRSCWTIKIILDSQTICILTYYIYSGLLGINLWGFPTCLKLRSSFTTTTSFFTRTFSSKESMYSKRSSREWLASIECSTWSELHVQLEYYLTRMDFLKWRFKTIAFRAVIIRGFSSSLSWCKWTLLN